MLHQHVAGCTLPGTLKANLVPDYARNHLLFIHRGLRSDSSRGQSAQMNFAEMSDSRSNAPKQGPEPGLALLLHSGSLSRCPLSPLVSHQVPNPKCPNMKHR